VVQRRNEKDLDKISEAQDKGLHAYAVALGKQYIAKYPGDPEGLWLVGVSLHQLNRYGEARKTLETAISLCSSDFLAPILSTLAEIHRDVGNFAAAERFFKESIKADPKEEGTYLDLCWMFQILDRNEEAEKCLRKGIDAGAAPSSTLCVRLADLLMSRNELVKASEVVARVLEEEPANEDALTTLEDIRHLAELQGLELPKPKTPSKQKHHPGTMTANIHREFFAAIAAGRKKVEYRAATEFWQTRIEKAGEPPFHLRIINGMTKNAPELTVGVEKVLLNVWEGEYELHLGKLIDLKGWDREEEAPTK
jgi:tetratricopeptide (TPR) repeat protein